MINIENTQVWGFEGAIRGMRMPYESFDKSDSEYGCIEGREEKKCKDYEYCPSCPAYGFVIGRADMTLAKKLIKGGSEHRKFMRMIHVQADVLAPRYWWAEMDKYKYVEANSSSTMHLITKRHLTEDDFSHDGAVNIPLMNVINILNMAIDSYNDDTKTRKQREEYFVGIKQLLPEGFNQLRTIDTNYECLLSIYNQRKNHRLSEWSGENGFCNWILSLPYMKEFLEY